MSAEMKQAPLLAGWAIATAAGLVAFGVSFVAMGLSPLQAAFVGTLILLVVGVILGFPGRIQGAPVVPQDHADRHGDHG